MKTREPLYGIPDWNDLPQEARVAAFDAARDWLRDETGAGDCALEIYNAIKQRTPQVAFPLFAQRDVEAGAA